MIELCCEYLSVRCIWLYVFIMSRTRFRVNPHSIVCLNVKELLARSRREIWRWSDCNWIRTHNHLVHKRTLNHFSQAGQMIELCCEYLSVRCIWLYVFIMSRTRFRVNPHSIVAWMSRNSLLEAFRACFEQGVPWHSGNYRVWIHSETRTWHDKNIQSNAPYR